MTKAEAPMDSHCWALRRVLAHRAWRQVVGTEEPDDAITPYCLASGHRWWHLAPDFLLLR